MGSVSRRLANSPHPQQGASCPFGNSFVSVFFVEYREFERDRN